MLNEVQAHQVDPNQPDIPDPGHRAEAQKHDPKDLQDVRHKIHHRSSPVFALMSEG
jgi:hypothetical protein